MSKDNRVRLPSSSAGITTYTDEYKSHLMLSPTTVFILIGVVAAFVIALHAFA